MASYFHRPVLLQALLEVLNPRRGGIYVDANLGGGGHAEAVLEQIEGQGTLIGFDLDPRALEAAQERLKRFPALRTVNANFAALDEALDAMHIDTIDGIYFDLGVSSPQLDVAERGFSIKAPGPLDMRFSPTNQTTAASLCNEASEATLRDLITRADVVIGAVLVPGAKAPKLVTRDMVKTMRKGSVLVDVAIDQGGCFETSRPTTHSDPIFVVDGVVHYCVANMPGAVAKTSTQALTNATLPYAVQIANKGWRQAMLESPEIARGGNVVNGKVTYKGVADAFGLDLAPVEKLLSASPVSGRSSL